MDLSTCSNPETWVEDPGGSLAGCIEPDPGRYVMYVNAACAFSGRSWFLIKFYGMEAVFQIVKTWPANSPDSWFFKPVSEWEKNAVESHPEACADQDPVLDATHLKRIYDLKPEYKGPSTVPLLYDKKNGNIVSNNSMVLAKSLCGEGMRSARTRNAEVELFPAEEEERKRHTALVEEFAKGALLKVYAINDAQTQEQHMRLSKECFATLERMEEILAASSSENTSQFLLGGKMSFVDVDLFNFAVRYDLAYRWKFNLGGDGIREGAEDELKYPAIANLVERFLAIEGITGKDGSVRPRDIVTGYWLSHTLNVASATKRVVPELPSAYARGSKRRVGDRGW